jgi:CheY-like chemotaxis protein
VRRNLFLALTLSVCSWCSAGLAQQPKGELPKAQAIYAHFRDLMSEGKFDIAALFLQDFLAANPTDADLLELEKKYGTTVFQSLRNVTRWSDDAAADKKTKAAIEEIIKRSRAASEKLLYDPARVDKYIRNLGATYEERVYAEQELRRTGDYAIPFMVKELRLTRDKDIYAGLLGAIKELEGHTMAGWVAALEHLAPEQQVAVVAAIVSRPDILGLQTAAQSDLSPFLWNVILQGREKHPTLYQMAERLLNKLHPGMRTDNLLPEVELTALARGFYEHKARFAGGRDAGAGGTVSVPVWVWNPMADTVSRLPEVPLAQAEEYYGLRYSRWVLNEKPAYEPAQALLISLAAERAIERAKYGNLATLEPAVFKLLSDTPSPILAEQLNRGLNQKRTGLVLALIQVLGDRADRDAATPPAGTPGRPSLLAKALSYPDPQVQFAAANALLRTGVPIPADARVQIVDILRRALGADTSAPGNTMGTAILADPNKMRSDAVALLLRGLGYNVEVVTTGRDLLRRIAQSSDFDLLLIDHHTPNPELIDLIGQIQADVKSGNRPTLVLASADKARFPTYDQLVVRFAAMIAATEPDPAPVPPPYVPPPQDKDNPDNVNKDRRTNQEQRDVVFARTVAGRVARLNRVIEATGLKLTETQKLTLALRVELINFAILGIEFPFSKESAPATVVHIDRLRRQLIAQPPTPPYGAGPPTTALVKLIERLEVDVARVPARKQRFEEIYSRIDLVELGLPVETFRLPQLEARLGRALRNYPGVKIIPEPFTRLELASDLQAVTADPAQAPRNPAEKLAAQRAAAEWLRKMAIGDLPGYDVKAAEKELIDALRADDLAAAAIDAVARFPSAEAQQALLTLAITPGRPLPLRIRAADAAIVHIQGNGKLIPKTLTGPLAEIAGTEPDLLLRGKLLTLKGMLAFNQDDYVNQLRTYNPPILPPAPKGEAPKGDAPKDKEKE